MPERAHMRLQVEPLYGTTIRYVLEIGMVDVARVGIHPFNMPTPGTPEHPKSVSSALRELAVLAELIEGGKDMPYIARRATIQEMDRALGITSGEVIDAEVIEPQIPPRGYEHILIHRGNPPAHHGATHEEDRSPE